MVQLKKASGRKKAFQKRFFLSYLLILLIPLLVTFPLYQMAYRIIEEKELQTRSMLMRECMSEMDNTIRNIDETLMEMCTNTSLPSLLYLSEQPGYGSSDAALLYSVNRQLATYVNYGGLKDLSIYLNRPDLVFSGSSITYGREWYYENTASYGDMSYEEFEESFLDSYHFRTAVGDSTLVSKRVTGAGVLSSCQSGILYVNSLPVGNSAEVLGTAVVHINSQIPHILNSVPISEYGCTYIADADQNILSGIFGENWDAGQESLHFSFDDDSGNFYADVGGQEVLVSYVRSPYNGWLYVSMSPMDRIMEGLRSFQALIVGISAAIFAVGLVLAALFSRRNSRPLEEALLELRGKYGTGGYSLAPDSELRSGIHMMLRDNEELMRTLEKQRSRMKEIFLDRLFHGEFHDEKDILSMENYLGMDLSGAMYGAVLLTFGSGEEDLSESSLFGNELLQVFTRRIVLRQSSMQTVSLQVSNSRLAILVCFSGDREEENRKLLSREFDKMIAETEEKFSENISASAGNLYTRLEDVAVSFGEAYTAAAHPAAEGEGLQFYRDVVHEDGGYFYPEEIEQKLKNLVDSGSEAEIGELLNYLYEENFVRRTLSRQAGYYLFMDVSTSVVKMIQELKLETAASDLFQVRAESFEPAREFGRLREICCQMAQTAGKQDSGGRLIGRVREYVEAHYSDSGMSIAMVAGEFHISESYFSQFFKKNTGQVFSKYLETLRINKACELIRDTSMSMDEIAAAVGYSSTLSFRRVFKKVMGVPPSSYR